MRKICWSGILLPVLLCAGLLTACSGQKVVYGEILSSQMGENGRLASLTIRRTDNGKEQTFSMTEKSRAYSLLENISKDDFLSSPQRGTYIAIATGSFSTVSDVEVMGWLEENAASLSDGAPLDILWYWDGDYTYRLADGTELLTVREGYGPDNVYVGGLESFDDLSETVREKILVYYEEQGPFYDEEATLERAYALWLEQGENYRSGAWLEQSITPAACNDRVMYFLTDITRPVWDGTGSVWKMCTAFDRETGEHIDNRDLFTCPEGELIEIILNEAQIADPALREEAKTAFQIENLIVFSDGLEASFPRGSLPSQEYAYSIVVDYEGEILEILQDWAIPVSTES